jgi:hypothetical protein
MNRLLLTLATALAVLASAQAASAGSPATNVGLAAGLGCAARCITKAWVTPNLTGATLEVTTDTPAVYHV